MGLTIKQKTFCEEYVRTGNATQAAIFAGYSQKTASAIGTENLQKPNLKSYIGQLSEELKKASIADADEVMQFLTSVLRDEVKEDKAIGTQQGVEIVNLPLDGSGRLKAAAELMKRYPLPVEVNINQPTAIALKFDFASKDEEEPDE